MNSKVKKATAITGSALLLAGMTTNAVGTLAFAGNDIVSNTNTIEAQTDTSSKTVTQSSVIGTFDFTQGEVSSIPVIKKSLAAANQYLCGSESSVLDGDVVAPEEWRISVGGDVQSSYSATLSEMSENGTIRLIVGCSCAGNPAGGIASINAHVRGISLSSIIQEARVNEEVNTIVFTSSDGFEVALPFSYITQRLSLIAYDLNGEPISNSMGGANQLWLGSTAASYFARNVVSINFEVRETPPPVPGSAESGGFYANVPNVGIVSGGEVE